MEPRVIWGFFFRCERKAEMKKRRTESMNKSGAKEIRKK